MEAVVIFDRLEGYVSEGGTTETVIGGTLVVTSKMIDPTVAIGRCYSESAGWLTGLAALATKDRSIVRSVEV